MPKHIHNAALIDPTRTGQIRRQFQNEMKRRMTALIKEVLHFILELDALGLAPIKPINLASVRRREFAFRSDPDKIKVFREWLQTAIDAKVLSTTGGGNPDEPWTQKYIESAYKKGLINAYMSARKEDIAEHGVMSRTQEQFLRSVFAQPETLSKVQLLATRAFEDLKGVTAVMSSQMNRILAQGMVDGSGPRKIAKEMSDSVAGLTRKRALVIARTETIRAHAQGQLDAFDELGIEELGVKSEWSTAGDARVCPQCSAMEGKVFTTKEAAGLIPLHPQCVLGNQIVECTNVLAVTRAKYLGKIINITTAHGKKLSVTENHVLATLKGWTAANKITKGDQLINASFANRDFLQAPNYKKSIVISDLFSFLLEMCPENLRRIPGAAAEYFHGDGAFIKEEIDIILSDGELWNSSDVSSFKKFKQFSFVMGDIQLGHAKGLDSFSSSLLHLHGHDSSPYRIMGRSDIACVFCGRSFGHHQTVGGRLISQINSSPKQSGTDDVSSASHPFRNFINTLPGPVEFDQVSNIDISEPVRGGVFVFDVWSHVASYTLNGLLSSNCRCSWIPHLPPGLGKKKK